MIISELITILQSLKETQGDLEVKYLNEEADCFYFINNVEACPGQDQDFIGIH